MDTPIPPQPGHASPLATYPAGTRTAITTTLLPLEGLLEEAAALSAAVLALHRRAR